MKLHETEIFNKLTQLRNLFTDARVEKIDKLDVDVSTRQAAQTAVEQKNELAQKIDAVPIVVPRCKIITTAGAGQFIVPENVYMLTADYCGAGKDIVSGTGGGGGLSIFGAKIPVTPGQVIDYIVGSPSSAHAVADTEIKNVGLLKATGAINAAGAVISPAVNWGLASSAFDYAANASTIRHGGGAGSADTGGACALMIYNGAGRGYGSVSGAACNGCIIFQWWEPVLATKINQE